MPIPRTIPLETEMLELLLKIPDPVPNGLQEVTGLPKQTAGPIIENPFKSMETLSALI